MIDKIINPTKNEATYLAEIPRIKYFKSWICPNPVVNPQKLKA